MASHTTALLPSQERISAFDGSTNNSNIMIINTHISPSMLGIMGAEEGIASRNLRLRQHTDNLSEYDC